jgi:energy-coupling factor transporter ATP-binding protein EcfA2
MSKITFITGKQGTGKSTLRRQLGGLDKHTREITLEEITPAFKMELWYLLIDDKEDSYFFECQERSENIDFPVAFTRHPNFTWYECYGVFSEGNVHYDIFPFLPF